MVRWVPKSGRKVLTHFKPSHPAIAESRRNMHILWTQAELKLGEYTHTRINKSVNCSQHTEKGYERSPQRQEQRDQQRKRRRRTKEQEEGRRRTEQDRRTEHEEQGGKAEQRPKYCIEAF